MKFLLLIILLRQDYRTAPSTTVLEFNTKEACEYAANDVLINNKFVTSEGQLTLTVKTSCYPTGEVKK